MRHLPQGRPDRRIQPCSSNVTSSPGSRDAGLRVGGSCLFNDVGIVLAQDGSSKCRSSCGSGNSTRSFVRMERSAIVHWEKIQGMEPKPTVTPASPKLPTRLMAAPTKNQPLGFRAILAIFLDSLRLTRVITANYCHILSSFSAF